MIFNSYFHNANTGNAVDLSGIPFSAIEQVEVLREGASALYGSDAIAGVINFITKKNYQGAEIQANFDKPIKSGGESGQIEFSLGTGDLKSDGYNFMVTGSYHRQQELTAPQRAFSAPGFDPAGGYTSTNNPGSRSASTCAYALVTTSSSSRKRRDSRADSVSPSKIAATSSAATSTWRAGGT